jgi:tetratricopeptide (TPR) repeat protein
MSSIKKTLLRDSRIRHLFVACLLGGILLAGCGRDAGRDAAMYDLFYKAELGYEEGRYAEAIEGYEAVAKRGLGSPELYYNLGNAYVKAGEIGKGMLNYARARALAPRDSAITANCLRAASMMKQPDAPRQASALRRELDKLFALMTLKESFLVFFSIYYLIALLLVCMIMVRRYRIIAIALVIVLGASLVLTIPPLLEKVREDEQGAMVIAAVVDVKKEPYAEAETAFPVYAGMKVYLFKEGVGWVKVQRPDGRSGWVAETSVEKIKR